MLSSILGQPKETAHICQDNTELPKTSFRLDTTADDEHVHPKRYCHKCHNTAKMSYGQKGAVVETAIMPFEWESHGANCCVCKAIAGRPKKSTKK